MSSDTSHFEPPRLPGPNDGATPVPPPPPLPAPTLPGQALPTLPPAAAAPAPAPPAPVAPALPDPGATPPTTLAPGMPPLPTGPDGGPPPKTTPEWKQRQRSPFRRILRLFALLVVLGGLGAAGWFGYQAFSADQEDSADEAPVEDGAAGGGGDSVIDRAEDAVDDINDRPEIDEALGDLGLDESGNPLPPEPPSGDDPVEAPAPATIAAYSFNWADSLGTDVVVTVDLASGDFDATAANGTALRRVGDRAFASDADGAWTEIDPALVAAVPVVGLDGPLTRDAILPEAVATYVTVHDHDESATGEFDAYLIDDHLLDEIDPDLRAAWLTPWGLDPDVPTEVTGDANEIPRGLGVPLEAATGEVVVTISRAPDGSVTEASISSPAIGGFAYYRVVETFTEPVVVEVPL